VPANRTAAAKLRTLPGREATFIEPMECLATAKLPDGPQWVWEIKLDGCRALAVKTASGLTFFSRQKKSLSKKFPYIVEALADLPPGTVVDRELVGLDDKGRPDFNLLQNFRGGASRIYYYVFDLLCCEGRDLARLPMIERRALLKSLVMVRDKRIRISDYIEAGADELLAAVRRLACSFRLHLKQ
jgi:ATP-dependent DNA ligase